MEFSQNIGMSLSWDAEFVPREIYFRHLSRAQDGRRRREEEEEEIRRENPKLLVVAKISGPDPYR